MAVRVPRTSESSAAEQATVERNMAHAPAERTGFLQRPSTGLLGALVAVHLLVLAVIIAKASSLGAIDADVGRAFRVATSPATPYRNFPVEFMPLQTAADRLLAGGTIGAAAIRIALLAFVADIAVFGAMVWGWGRRVAATYLIFALPLLPFLYLRFDLVSVALAAWAYAWLRRNHEELGGAALGLAVMAKLWPIALAPVFWLRRSRRGLLIAAVACVVIGGWWYLTGGVKGPFQVLSLRDTRGWHVESVIGSFLWVLHRGDAYREADAMRIGAVAAWMKALLGVALLAVEVFIWRRAAMDRRDPMGAASLAAVAALAVFAPILSMQAAAWLLPFAALALDGDHDERHTAGVAAVAIALTGVIAIVWRDHATAPAAWVPWLVLARNLVWIDVVVSWVRVRMLERPVIDPAPLPQRRSTDTDPDGIRAVLPFDAE
jgi:Glycosyltransferase family 87